MASVMKPQLFHLGLHAFGTGKEPPTGLGGLLGSFRGPEDPHWLERF